MISCSQKKKDYTSLIYDNDYCYWKYKESDDALLWDYHYFDVNGNWLAFEQKDSNTIVNKYRFCSQVDEKWFKIDEKTIDLSGYNANILAINDSVIVLEEKVDSIHLGTYILYKIDRSSNEYEKLEMAKIKYFNYVFKPKYLKLVEDSFIDSMTIYGSIEFRVK
jgi:hypothetical protein